MKDIAQDTTQPAPADAYDDVDPTTIVSARTPRLPVMLPPPRPEPKVRDAMAFAAALCLAGEGVASQTPLVALAGVLLLVGAGSRILVWLRA